LILNSTQYAGALSPIKISVSVQENQIFIFVEDEGPGITFENQKKLFEKFYRVPGTPAGGTGLGLSIVKGIVELHKGKIHFENIVRDGRSDGAIIGGRFVISLPYLVNLTQNPRV